ncbi:MAG: hypothetical protein KDA59_14965, partial [Planctomycetales bacterium]|nr:hypothetical protein [Planctomycetales bacterium]
MAGICFLLSIVATWPLALHVHSHMPLGQEGVATVPLLNAWTMWWNGQAAEQGFSNYWDAPIFYPERDALAFSEPLPTTLAAWPLYKLTGSLTWSYNTLLLVSLTLNGISTFALLRHLRLDHRAALLGGAMMTVLPFVFAELGVWQLVALFPTIWTLHALLLWVSRPSYGRGALLGGVGGLTYWTCGYYGLFLATLLAASAWILLGRKWRSPRTWLRLLLAFAVAGTMIGPVARVQMRVAKRHGLQRPAETVRRLSADWRDYSAPPYPSTWQRLHRWISGQQQPLPPRANLFRLHAGWVKYGLAVLGIVVAVRTRPRWKRRWAVFALTLLVLAFCLSLGLRAAAGGISPYAWLMQWIPGYAQIRSPFRFAMFVQMMCVLFAATGIHGALRFANARLRGRSRLALRFVVFSIGLLAVVELWPPPAQLVRVPLSADKPAWAEWVREHTPRDAILVCFPMPNRLTVEAYESATMWMIWQTRHERRMVNGYSAFTPQSHLTLQQRVARFPDDASLRALAEWGVTYCVVKRSAGASSLERVTTDGRWRL